MLAPPSEILDLPLYTYKKHAHFHVSIIKEKYEKCMHARPTATYAITKTNAKKNLLWVGVVYVDYLCCFSGVYNTRKRYKLLLDGTKT